MGRVWWMWALCGGCAGADAVPTPVPPDYPSGDFEAAFRFWLPAGFPWTTQPRARLSVDERTASGVIEEVWRVDNPFFGDCPTALEFTVDLDWPSDRTWATFEGSGDLVEDPCALGPYGTNYPLILVLMPLDEARGLLLDAADAPGSLLDARLLELETDREQPSLPWFLFWGESPDALWPIGHLFDAPTDR